MKKNIKYISICLVTMVPFAILVILTIILLSGCGKNTASQGKNVPLPDSIVVYSNGTSKEYDKVAEGNIIDSISEEDLVKKCLDGYIEYLRIRPTLWHNETVYSLDYVNDDDIPDLIFGDTTTCHAANVYVLTYLDGNYDNVICCGKFGAYGAACYYPGLGIMLTSDMAMGYDTEYYSMLTSESDCGFKTLCHRYYYYEEDYNGEPSEKKYFIGKDEEVTEEEYDKYVNELVGELEHKVFYTFNNYYGYKYLNQETIDNGFKW